MRNCYWPRLLAYVMTVMAATTVPVLAEVHVVELIGIEFIPRDITIVVGDTVRWDWVSGFHNVESGIIVSGQGVHDGNFRSGDPTSDRDTIFELVFDQAFLDAHPMSGDLYPYFCIVHAGVDMAGTVQVVDCSQNADCDDGLFCNGAETCVGNTCQAGTDPCPREQCDESADACVECSDEGDCDDGVECTIDGCVDGMCVFVPDDALCDDGLFCNGSERCVDGVCIPGRSPCKQKEICDEDTDSCRVPVGACCVGGGCLQDLDEDFCDDVLGGAYAGDFTDCDQGVCDPGACCLPTGECAEMPEATCSQADGEFQGIGTDCGSTDCPQPPGACCINFVCVPGQREDNCLGAGGRWAGPFTNCDDDPDICAECIRNPEWQCDGDTDGDGQVNPVDSGLVQAAFGSTDQGDLCQYDMDCDGQINPVDSGIVRSLFGTCEEPREACP